MSALAHGTSDTPIYQLSRNSGAEMLLWTTACRCGWGATGDSPEALVLSLALHLYESLPDDAPERSYYSISRKSRDDGRCFPRETS